VRPARAAAAIALGLALALAGHSAGCGRGAAAERRPNVLIVTLDSLRTDRLGAYRQTAREVTPRLDAFAAQSIVFEQAFATSSFTPPTHASILTGLYPSEHGMLWWNRQLADVHTAAEIFQAAGYRTGAFTPLKTLLELGLSRGFDEQGAPAPVDESVPDGQRLVLADADAVNALALPWLTAGGEGRPFFAWVHYYDAHRPYGRQGPQWSGRFVAPGADDPDVGATERWYQLTPEKRAALGLTPAQTALLKDHYDGGAAYLDDRVGRLLDGLSEAGLLDTTIVVLLSDHGEVLDEYPAEWFSHDPWLVDENVHVPFLLRLPGGERAGTRVDALVSQIDVLPTLLALAGLDARVASEPVPLSGLDLSPAWSGRRLPRETVYADRQGDDRDGKSPQRSRMLRSATRKLVHDEDRQVLELWAEDGSAQEGLDISGRDRDAKAGLVEAYRQQLERLRVPGSASTHGDLAPDTQKMLDSLGYTGKGR